MLDSPLDPPLDRLQGAVMVTMMTVVMENDVTAGFVASALARIL